MDPKTKIPTNIETRFSHQSRTERLIATGRAVLAGFFLLAIWLDPFEPSEYSQLTYGILAGYLVYSLILAIIVWRMEIPQGHWQIMAHALDLIVFVVIIFFTQGPTSPFFAYFVFSLVCATLRWQWRGTFWTAAVALSTVFCVTLFPEGFFHDPDLLNHFIIRAVYLAVVAVMLGYLGSHEQKLRAELSKLAAWPRTISADIPALTRGTLEHTADVMGAPRILLIWEENEEPWLHLSSWSQGEFSYTREAPDIFGNVVAEPVASASFFCQDVRAPQPLVVYNSPNGLKRWQGNPLHSRLQAEFAVGTVLCLKLRGENLNGYLFILDKERMTTDDLVIGEIVAQRVITRLDTLYMLKQLQQTAATEERIRLARDLHDGLLQSLTAAALELETVYRLLKTDPETAQQRLLEIQGLISAEQRDLRSHIHELKPGIRSLADTNSNLAPRLEELCRRIKRHWGLNLEVNLNYLESQVPRDLTQEIYFIIHESLINVAKHAKASTARVDLAAVGKQLTIKVADNGRGFPFQGHYDHDTLTRMKLGPVTLKERIESLGGSLSIVSNNTGTCLEIILPLAGEEG